MLIFILIHVQYSQNAVALKKVQIVKIEITPPQVFTTQ